MAAVKLATSHPYANYQRRSRVYGSLNKHFYHHSTAKLGSLPWFAQRCDLHAANRVQTSLCIQRFRLSALFMLLTKVGTTWEISGLMNLILSFHFARVFCNAAQWWQRRRTGRRLASVSPPVIVWHSLTGCL